MKKLLPLIISALSAGIMLGTVFHSTVETIIKTTTQQVINAWQNAEFAGVNDATDIKDTMSVVYFDPSYGNDQSVELKITEKPMKWNDPTIITIVKNYTMNGDLVGVTVLYQNTYEKTKNFPHGDYNTVEYWQIQVPVTFEITAGEEIAKEIATSFSSTSIIARYYAYGRGHGIGYEE